MLAEFEMTTMLYLTCICQEKSLNNYHCHYLKMKFENIQIIFSNDQSMVVKIPKYKYNFKGCLNLSHLF